MDNFEEKLNKYAALAVEKPCRFHDQLCQLDIDGIMQDGSIEPLFRSGNWAS